VQNIAAIDAGSNGIRMAVARLGPDGRLQVLSSARAPVRLGADAFAHGQITEPTMQLVAETFARFRKTAADLMVTRLRAVATSAMRESRNSDVLIDRIARETGINVEVISGEEESRLIHLAIGKVVDLGGKRAMLVDIGGGSVEVTLTEGDNIVSSESYRMGTVRLLQKFDGDGRSRQSFNRMVKEYAEATRRRLDHEIGRQGVDLCVGTGGNIEEMGELAKRIFRRDSARLITARDLRDLGDLLGALTAPERAARYNLRPDRADVIMPACVVLQSLVKTAGVREVLVPGVGLKDGVLWDLAAQADPRPPRREQVWSSAAHLGGKYELDAEHGGMVADLATQIFDQTTALHGLGAEERLVLEVAALLHDIGYFVNAIDHDRHGHYLLHNSFLFGLTEPQQAVVANIVRYHRRTAPTLEHGNFKALAPRDRVLVNKLCALLRLADGIDTGHAGRVRRVGLNGAKSRWTLTLEGEGDLALEKWTLTKRRAMFQDVFGVELAIA
jgi:exopolyphosphatase/guanosine-5'-triphosphate,3'-diphosphate pyrophosphatase